jgi:ADP-ribosylglycohydrolase
LIGAIAGDVIGAPYEYANHRSTEFELFGPASAFTDDTVLTLAIADAIVRRVPYRDALLEWACLYPKADYGGTFRRWSSSGGRIASSSYGNGSAMRVSPVGLAFDTLEETLDQARLAAEVTHGHPEGIKGAQATAAAMWQARSGWDGAAIREYAEREFAYDLAEPIASIRAWYQYDVTCQGTVPVALRAFLEADDWEQCIRLGVSVGGDTDTLCAIAGAVAEAAYGVPEPIVAETMGRLDDRIRGVVTAFYAGLGRAVGAPHPGR